MYYIQTMPDKIKVVDLEKASYGDILNNVENGEDSPSDKSEEEAKPVVEKALPVEDKKVDKIIRTTELVPCPKCGKKS